MKGWFIENNLIEDNNLPNPAEGAGLVGLDGFPALLPSGCGVLMLGVSDHKISGNDIRNNDLVGVGVLGWCTVQSLIEDLPDCLDEDGNQTPEYPDDDPSSNNNEISFNRFFRNGRDPPDPDLGVPGSDILYAQYPDAGEKSDGNCFRKNRKYGRFFSRRLLPFLDYFSLPDVTRRLPRLRLPRRGCP